MTYEQQYHDPSQNSYTQPSNGGEPPVGEPLFDAGFLTATKRFFKGYVVFRGRASRAEYWWAYLAINLIMFVAVMIYVIGMVSTTATMSSSTMAGNEPQSPMPFILSIFGWLAPLLLFSLAILLPSYAAMWRRLQDAGFHGAFALLNLLGFGIVPLIMCILPTSPQALRFGPGAVPGTGAGYYPAPQQHGQQAYGQQGYGQQGQNPNFPQQ